MADMSLRDAFHVADTLRNHYQAFEKLSQLFALGAGLEQALQEIKERVDAARAEEATARDAAALAKAEHESLVSRLQQKKSEAEVAFSAFKQEITA